MDEGEEIGTANLGASFKAAEDMDSGPGAQVQI